MSTGDHLTIRDYFDQVITGKPRNRKTSSFSRGSEGASGAGMFYRMLAARQSQGVRNGSDKTTGLTIADYLANPLGVKCRYQPSPEFSSAEVKGNPISEQQEIIAKKASPGKESAASLVKTKPAPSVGPPIVTDSVKKSKPDERQRIETSIQQAANKYNLPPGLIKGVIRAESNFRADAVSPAGAQGLMQLMPATAKELGVIKPFDIDQNIDGGSRYLRKMLDSFNGDIKLALAAYNAGPGTVRKYDGDVPYPETIKYIERVLRFSEQTA
jgi:Transglycosylase SLT domain